jgi:hypothetical protein
MTSELSPSTRALLDAARGGGPDAAAIARMRGKIDLAVSGAPAVVTATTKGSLIGGKLGLVALAVIVATGAYVVSTRSRAPVETVAEPAIEPIAISQHSAREAAPAAAAPEEIEMPPIHRAPVVPPKRIELAREVELVDTALTALRRGEARAALAAVRSYTLEAGTRGQLAEDAAAIEVEALCTLREPTASARQTAFAARWPASAQHAKLARACR